MRRILPCLLGATLLGPAASSTLVKRAEPALTVPSLEGQPAPDIQRNSLDGLPVRLSAFRGKVVLLNFWATWCTPCLSEVPIFSAWSASDAANLRVVGVAMDDDPGPVRTETKRLHLGYPVVMGDAALARAYGGVLGLPVTFLLDRQGVLRKRYDSASALTLLQRDLEALLKEPPRSQEGR